MKGSSAYQIRSKGEEHVFRIFFFFCSVLHKTVWKKQVKAGRAHGKMVILLSWKGGLCIC